MTSKERVNAVLCSEIPDKVPWGEWAVDFDTVGKIIGHETYYRAKARSQFALWEGRRDEVVQSWKEDAIEFFRKMDCFDIINVSAMASSVAPPKDYEYEKPKKLDDNTWEFSDGTVVKHSEVTADITKIYDPNVGKKQYTPADFEKDPVVCSIWTTLRLSVPQSDTRQLKATSSIVILFAAVRMVWVGGRILRVLRDRSFHRICFVSSCFRGSKTV